MLYQDYDPVFDVSTDEKTGVRFYEIGGIKYPSVTTVLGHSTKRVISDWKDRVGHDKAGKITRQAGLVGNALHDACEQYLLVRGTAAEANLLKSLKKNPFHWAQFQKVRKILDNLVTTVYLSETFLYSPRLRMAGRCDLVADYMGKKTMLDFKTSGGQLIPAKIEKYKMQGLSYILMHNEIFTDETRIEDFAVISAPGDSPTAKALEFQGIIDEPNCDRLDRYIGDFHAHLDRQRQYDFAV
jgi:hypothetical protein